VLRSIVLVFWVIVAMWSRESLWRTLFRRGDNGDHKEAALVVTGVSVVGFQINALWGSVAHRTDPGTAVFLAILVIPPLMICWLVYLPRTPAGHKRGAVLTFLAIAVACAIGGSLG
jgi:hypothetical protein